MPQKNSIALIVSAVIIVGAIAAIVWYQGGIRGGNPTPSLSGQPPAGRAITSPDLGSSLYEQVSNPVQDKLPESIAPVSNPIEGVYKNPFE